MNTTKSILIGFVVLIMSSAHSFGTNQLYSSNDIKVVFDETKKLCSKDNGLLWGHNLNVPILFVDEENGLVYSNKNSSKLKLEEMNQIYVGSLPDFIKVEKGPQKIDKRIWAVIPLPLPKNKTEQQCIILHEAFHCLQPKIDLKPLPYNNNHMEEMEARLWLKLEWKALEFALQNEGEDRKQAIIDAICFRKYRRALFSDCDACENRFEIHEGMAEYTANKISRTPTDFKNYLLGKLDCMWGNTSFVDCFAYYSGPVYAYLLDDTDFNWRNQLGSKDDISILIQSAYNISLPFDVFMEAEERSVLYNGAKIMGEELDREITL
ncbi:hypothetical protein [Marinifilum sp.]|uniref:hypothetical protein n=1 Tax=Marinifilum sp. TaxID=2033137 RepID=UPI003BAA5E0B